MAKPPTQGAAAPGTAATAEQERPGETGTPSAEAATETPAAAKPVVKAKDETPAQTPALKLPPELARAAVMSGAEDLADGLTHVGMAVMMTSAGKPSTVVISDVTRIGEGAPVYITKPMILEFKKLEAFLEGNGVQMDSSLKGFMRGIDLSCDAFYYSHNGPLLMMFSLTSADGIIKSVVKGKDEKLGEQLGDLFDVKGGSVRIFRCSRDKLPVLQAYAAELTGEPAPALKPPPGEGATPPKAG